MTKYLKIILITALFWSSLGYAQTVSAEVLVKNITISNIKDSRATIKWNTNFNLRSAIYYGLEADNLDTKISNYSYKTRHEIGLYNLKKDKVYYYQIIVWDSAGHKTKLYPQSFSTKNMLDTRAPKISQAKIVQILGNALALIWQTNEKTSSEISYWPVDNFSNKKTKKVRSYANTQNYFLYNISPNTEYYLKITVKDKAGNKDSKTFHLNIYDKLKSIVDLKITNIKPSNSNSELISGNTATIKFKTNLATKTKIYYGTNPKRLNKKTYLDNQEINTQHSITLNNLESNTTYYYKIYAYGGLYNKKTKTNILSFDTKNAPKILKISSENNDNGIDSDNDGLSDAYELSIGTDPLNIDSDNDSYPDGLEVANNYNPLGLGKLVYNKKQLSTKIENAKIQELRNILNTILFRIDLDQLGWQTAVNGYIYGDYPIKAIVKYVLWKGKTIHPTIPWSEWKNNQDYITYINK